MLRICGRDPVVWTELRVLLPEGFRFVDFKCRRSFGRRLGVERKLIGGDVEDPFVVDFVRLTGASTGASAVCA